VEKEEANVNVRITGLVTDPFADLATRLQGDYVRIVDERKDGIVVRGAKAHISEAPLANEIIILPCRAMREDDQAYAVSFAVQANAKGLTLISAEPEIKESGNFFDNPITASIYLNDAMVIFDDVFIPAEKVFMCGEVDFAGLLIQLPHELGDLIGTWQLPLSSLGRRLTIR
jgi:4-hydroxybutyryl-CoA dehydratase/vinylacetyl-CoA-Delta-isomerase